MKFISSFSLVFFFEYLKSLTEQCIVAFVLSTKQVAQSLGLCGKTFVRSGFGSSTGPSRKPDAAINLINSDLEGDCVKRREERGKSEEKREGEKRRENKGKRA